MKEEMYITISDLDDYFVAGRVRPGMKMQLLKDHNNPYDDEAIQVRTERGEKCGYVANSVDSVCRGTYSAGHIYDCFAEESFCTVKFSGDNFAIAAMGDLA